MYAQYRKDTYEPILDLPPMSFEKIDAIFHQQKAKWEAGNQYTQLISTLDSVPIQQVKKIVAFACFDLSYPEPGWERPATQYALILIFQEYIAKRQDVPREEIQCFAQDPVYQEVDKQFLAHVGVTVL